MVVPISYIMKKLISFFFTIILFAGCSSKLRVTSDPQDAEVFVHLPDQSERKSLGRTPLEIPWSDLSNKYGISPSSGDYLQVDIEKNEFKTDRILVPAHRTNSISTAVKVKLEPGISEGKVASQMIQLLFNAQKLANDKQFERALVELDKAFLLDSNFVRGLSLRGMILFLQGDLSESLKTYEKVTSIDPYYDDAIKMISFIRKKRGVASDKVESPKPSNSASETPKQ